MTKLHVVQRIDTNAFIGNCDRCNNTYKGKGYRDSLKSRVGNLCNPCKNFIIEMKYITQAKLQQAFDYNQHTGEIRFKQDFRKSISGELATAKHSQGYLTVTIGGKAYLAHRIIFMYMLNIYPEQTDHINHMRDDNRWANLRNVDSLGNNRNNSRYLNNTSGFTGVSLHKATNKYTANITLNHKQVYLGLFTSIEEAVEARTTANKEHQFHENHGK